MESNTNNAISKTEDNTLDATGLCPECNKPNTGYKWCRQCNGKRFQQDFSNWTSGNNYIDNFIQETQLIAQKRDVLEWIPYDRLTNIKYLAKGGFSTVYKAIWLDGSINYWDNDNKQWDRYIHDINSDDNKMEGYRVVIKSLGNSSNIDESNLNEWKFHFNCHKNVKYIVRLFGFTQDPNNSDYMIVMNYAEDGSLRNSLKNKFYNWIEILYTLHNVISGLNTIHESNLVHCNLHDGNILRSGLDSWISDLRLCKPVNYFKSNGDIYGIIPYMAPEVLRGKSLTQASDIYSFAMIMWELTSGIPPFDDRAHDFQLILSICTGERPEIIEGTPQCYIDLMKKCWDLDPLQRPTASDVNIIIENWHKNFYDIYEEDDDEKVRKYLENIENEQLRKDIEEFWKADKALKEKRNKPIVNKSHPQAYHTSRLLDFSKKLNDILEQKEKENL